MILKHVRRPIVAMFIWFALALIPRVIFYQTSGPYGMVHVIKDARLYLTLGSKLWSEGSFATTPGEPHCVVAPLYPMFLAPFVGAFGFPPREALWVQLVLSAAMPCLCYWIGRRLHGNLAGWLAGLFAVGYLVPAAFASRFMTENLAVPLFLLSLLLGDMLLERPARKAQWGLAVAIGGLFALQALTRFVSIPLLAVPLLLYAIAARREPKRALVNVALACLSFVVVYSPWVIRNYAAFGEVILTRKGEANIALNAQVGYRANLETSTLGEARTLARKRANEYAKRGDRPPLREFDAGLYLRQSLLRLRIMLGAHPSLELPFPFAGRHFGRSRIIAWENYLWSALMFACVLAATVLALARRCLRLFHTIALPFGLIGCYSVIHAIPRYQTVPYMGLTIAAGIGLSVILAPLSQKILRTGASTETAGARLPSG